MKQYEVNMCEKKDGTFEPRYVNLMPHEIEAYEKWLPLELTYDQYEELVEAPTKEEARLVCEYLKEHYKGKVDFILWLS